MKFQLSKASNWRHIDEIEINTLEELMDFIKENGEIIMGSEHIKIYDDYVE